MRDWLDCVSKFDFEPDSKNNKLKDKAQNDWC